MVRRSLLPLLVLLVLGAAPAAAPAATPVTHAVAISRLTATTDVTAWARDLDQARTAGFNAVRMEVLWDDLQPAGPTNDPGYVAVIDAAFAELRARGMQAIVIFQASPCWASRAPAASIGACTTPAQQNEAGRFGPKHPADYANAAAFLARRYSANLRALEVWNEVDHRGEYYWGGGDKPKTYAALLKATYPKVKAASRRTLVLGGALVGADGKFLTELYKQKGFKSSYDALSVHYYDLVLASLRSIRVVQRKHGDRKPLWLGEFGWNACLPAREEGGHACVSEANQGRFIADVFAALPRASYMRGAVLYALQDSGLHFGLFRGDVAKPALDIVAKALARTPTPRKVTLTLKAVGGQVVASGCGPVADAYELDVFRGTRLRYRATYRLDRDGCFSIPIPKQVGTHGLTVRAVQYWLGGGTTRRI